MVELCIWFYHMWYAMFQSFRSWEDTALLERIRTKGPGGNYSTICAARGRNGDSVSIIKGDCTKTHTSMCQVIIASWHISAIQVKPCAKYTTNSTQPLRELHIRINVSFGWPPKMDMMQNSRRHISHLYWCVYLHNPRKPCRHLAVLCELANMASAR